MGRSSACFFDSRPLKKHHLLRCAYPSSVNVLPKYVSFLMIARALHLALFERPAQMDFFNGLIIRDSRPVIVLSDAEPGGENPFVPKRAAAAFAGR
jgi:hypothetical protein